MRINAIYQNIIIFIRTRLTTLNVYESPNDDPDTIHRGILATRLFLLLLIIATVTLSTGAFVRENIKTETIHFPSISVFESLERKYSDTLVCPCSKIAITIGKFADVQPSFHQVCSSDFVSQRWIDFIFGADATSIWIMDIRTSISAMWQLIASFCQSSVSTVNSGIDDFKSRLLFSSTAISQETLTAKSNATLGESKLKMKIDLHTSFNIFLITIMISMPMTGLMTNYRMWANGLWSSTVGTTGTSGIRYVFPDTYDNCDCFWANSCQLPANVYFYKPWETNGIYNLNLITANETIPGLFVNCIPFQGVYNSALECFFNSSCLDLLISIYQKNINISALEKSVPSRFSPSNTISQLFAELFMEDIVLTTNFPLYYNECAPISCTYSYSYRFSVAYVITTLIALLGGLATVLRVVCPHLINLILIIKRIYYGRTEIPQEQGETISLRNRVKRLIGKLVSSLMHLNIFDDGLYDETDIGLTRIFTRFYLIVASFSLIIIGFYTFVSTETMAETRLLPSLDQYEALEEKYKDLLSCPCSNISVSYGDIIEIQPVYHQLCQSDFVQDQWIYSLTPAPLSYAITDFRILHNPYFSSLALMCNTFKNVLANATEIFSTTKYTNTQIVRRNLFIPQINSLISDFQTSTKTQFFYSFSIINSTLNAEQYASFSKLSLGFLTLNWIKAGVSAPNPIDVISVATGDISAEGTRCFCVRDASCTWNWQKPTIWIIDGVNVRCNILETVLSSSLVCLFNNSCLDGLKEKLNYGNVIFVAHATPLNSSLQSRFSPDTSIKAMFEEMMIESWKINSSYEKFYDLCQPSYCTSSYEHTFSTMYTIMTLAGLVGGLNLILRWISFLLMKIVSLVSYIVVKRSRIFHTNTQETFNNQTVLVEETSLWAILKNKFMSLNLFRNESNDITHQRHATRFYILMLFICLWFITVYTAWSDESVLEIITSPSDKQYQDLLALQNVILSCPCKRISIPYGTFININTTFHQVCTSDFVQGPWIDFLFGNGIWGFQNRSDIRGRGAAYFSLLSVLCSLSQLSINKATKEFLEKTWITAQPISDADFQQQTDAIIYRFLTNTKDNIGRNLNTMHSYLYSNSFLSGYFLNWYMWIHDTQNETASIITSPRKFDNRACSCATRSDCKEPVGIYGALEITPRWTIPGLYVGCSVYDSVMQSTLECFYTKECIWLIEIYVTTIDIKIAPPPSNITFQKLDSTLPSRYQMNTPIIELVNELFVEEWIINVSYSEFYSQCSPIHCSYTMRHPSSLVYILSRMLGLYGGLTLALRIMIPKVVLIYLTLWNRYLQNRITPFIQRRI